MSKKVLMTFILLILTSLSSASDGKGTKNFLRIDYGLGSFKSDKLDSYNANPVGKTFGAAFGTRFDFLELGFIYRKMSFTGEIISDGVKNKIIHNGNTFGLDMSIFLNRRFSLKVGYSINSYEQSLEKSVSAASLIAIKSTYGLEVDHSSSGVFYGGSVDIFDNPQYDLYFSVIHFPTSNSGSSTVAQVGIRIYVKSVLETFFSYGK